MTTDSSFLHYLLIHLLLSYILFSQLRIFKPHDSIEPTSFFWINWEIVLPKRDRENSKCQYWPLTKHTYIHRTFTWISATWWGVWDLHSVFPGKKLLQLHYQLKIWIICFPASHLDENKELLWNQQKHPEFWCKDGLTHSSSWLDPLHHSWT